MMRFICVLLCILAANSFAANESVPMDRKVTHISVYEEVVVVHFSPEFINTQSCPHTGKSSGVIKLSGNQGEALYSAILAAAAAKSNVGFGFGGCENHPLIYRVDVAY